MCLLRFPFGRVMGGNADPLMWYMPDQTITRRGIKEIVAARSWDYHTLPEGLALYTTALCALWNIQLSRTGVRCGRYVPRDLLPATRQELRKEKCVVGEERRRDGSLLRRPGDGP